jgi:hypothetical protein
MEFQRRTLRQLAELICGNEADDAKRFFPYRSSMYLTEFFEDIETDYRHDGSTRSTWVAGVLAEIIKEVQPGPNTLPDTFVRVIRRLLDRGDAFNEESDRPRAVALVNDALAREGFQAFYGDDRVVYLRHMDTNAVASAAPNPHRPFTAEETKRRDALIAYLNRA